MNEDVESGTTAPVMGALNGRLKGRFRAKGYTVVFTRTQTIFARFTSALLTQEIADERATAEDHGAGWFGKWKAQMGAYGTFTERYKSMSVEEILAEHKRNFAIDNQSVQSVHLSDAVTRYDVDENTYDVKSPLLTITTPSKTYKLRLTDNLRLSEYEDYGQVKDLLQRVYGQRFE